MAVVAQVVARLEALEVRLEVLVARLEDLLDPQSATARALRSALESGCEAPASDE
jgi:hypothetical protein